MVGGILKKTFSEGSVDHVIYMDCIVNQRFFFFFIFIVVWPQCNRKWWSCLPSSEGSLFWNRFQFRCIFKDNNSRVRRTRASFRGTKWIKKTTKKNIRCPSPLSVACRSLFVFRHETLGTLTLCENENNKHHRSDFRPAVTLTWVFLFVVHPILLIVVHGTNVLYSIKPKVYFDKKIKSNQILFLGSHLISYVCSTEYVLKRLVPIPASQNQHNIFNSFNYTGRYTKTHTHTHTHTANHSDHSELVANSTRIIYADSAWHAASVITIHIHTVCTVCFVSNTFSGWLYAELVFVSESRFFTYQDSEHLQSHCWAVCNNCR